MSALYIHIPFCKHKCHYCNFFSTVSLKNKPEIVDAIITEIEQKKNYLDSNILQSIYFGGGTPSILSENDIQSIFTKIHEIFVVSRNCEITFEANPDDISHEKLKLFKKLGINRLSIGIQSFNNDILKQLNRSHSSEDAINSVLLSKEYGFDNLNIDLIYGIPGLSDDIWKRELDKFLSFDIPHLSAYALTVEPKTALNVLISKNKYPSIDEDTVISHFNYLIEFLNLNNYNQYEISNFSKLGMESKHNSNYWKNKSYLGIGPSANSFNIKSRQWNHSSIKLYLDNINKGIDYEAKELLSINDRFNEYLMLGLRTSWGINVEIIKNTFGLDYKNHLMKYIDKNSNYFLIDKNIIVLTSSYRMLADRIAIELFI